MNLKPEEKEVGRENFYDAVGAYDRMNNLGRRDFLKAVVGAGVVSGAGLGAMWFGYSRPSRPLRIGVIGTGDEGGVLIGALNPDYVEVKAIADIRPSSVHRALHGDHASPAAYAARRGLMNVYGWHSESEARKHVTIYENGYDELLRDPNIEAVIIALPLHLHAHAAVQAMVHGKHVLTEKLMAHNVAQCKVMSRVADQENLLLATGHQRHYNILYDNAVNLIRWGVLGQIHFIRAQWHRGNLPGKDSWAQPIPGGEMGYSRSGKQIPIDPIADQLRAFKAMLASEGEPSKAELLKKKVAQWEAWNQDQQIRDSLVNYGYGPINLPNNQQFDALHELVRWRLWERTGGGLMAELGSHQLDAAQIFISALRAEGKASHPLTVHAVGGRHIFPQDRDSDDHVYCTLEFPGPHYDPGYDPGYWDPVMNVPDPKTGIPSYEHDPNKKIVMTYSSVNGNGYGGYGETVMGTKGTLVLEREKEVMLYKSSDTSTRVGVKKGAGGPTMDTQESGAGPAKAAVESGPVSRGYTEQIEHWAWCIMNPDPANRPKCHPEVAVADATIALTSKHAMANGRSGKSGYIRFKEEWFDINRDEVPYGPTVKEEWANLHKRDLS
ncbi:Gfo/Idh/MocA family protein [Lignipirellula cremea]|uniref:Glucose--fructose oxidoreductase n=1 Tax=Lignipirellula cremea TaxID=2528010 RepID=A0A518E1U6_9BACT|nr:Gfo/Idh/MocA family oxidoreductase [Lignipirellula cremea]QDU98051.1 Glucose--fructose oxidoreductase precursor [Lignipirellula cremea]